MNGCWTQRRCSRPSGASRGSPTSRAGPEPIAVSLVRTSSPTRHRDVHGRSPTAQTIKGGQMADVSAHTPIFSRGSTVLDYWLAHAEGLTIQPLGARVEEVVVVAPVGRAESLVVRSRVTRRRKRIPADAIAAVAPSTGDLLLDPPEPRAPFDSRAPRPSGSPPRAATPPGRRIARRPARGPPSRGRVPMPRAPGRRPRATDASLPRASPPGSRGWDRASPRLPARSGRRRRPRGGLRARGASARPCHGRRGRTGTSLARSAPRARQREPGD